MATVVGIDPSLTSTGLAVVTQGQIVKVDHISTEGKKEDDLLTRHRRLVWISSQVLTQVHQVAADLVVIEGPSNASKYGHPHDRSGLWWMLVDALVAMDVPVAVAPPSCRMKYATGKGNVGKDLVLSSVVRRYEKNLRTDVVRPSFAILGSEAPTVNTNDEADALVLAVMGARYLAEPVEAELPKTHLAGMDGVAWPEIKKCTSA